MFQGVQLDYFQSQNNVLCGIGQIIGGGGVTGRAYFGLFLILVYTVTQFQGTVGVISSHTHQKMTIGCLYFLFYIIF